MRVLFDLRAVALTDGGSMTKNLARLKKICANVGMHSLYLTLFQNRFAQIHYSSQMRGNGRKTPKHMRSHVSIINVYIPLAQSVFVA